MSPQVAVKVADRASYAISAPNVVVLILLAIFAYVLFAGDDKPRQDQGPSGASVRGGASYEPPVDNSARPSPSLTIDPRADSPLSNGDSPWSDEAPAVTPDPDRWRDENYDSRALRFIPTNPTRAPPAIRSGDGSPARRQRRVQIPATPADEIVHTHRDDMMRGGGHQEEESWKDWKSARTAGGEWNPAPAQTKEQKKEYRIKQDIEGSQAAKLFAGQTLAPGMLARMCQLEKVAQQDGRGVSLTPVLWGHDGKTLPLSTAKDLIAHIDDPMADNWDDVWGSLPILGMEAAEQVARVISKEDIEELGRLMVARRKASVADERRDWKAFVERAAPNEGGKLDQIRLTMGWFADTYRSVSHPLRMCISHKIIDMREKIPRVVNGLQWLEAMAWHLRRQRMLGPLGVDIHGLGLRLAVPCTLSKDRKPGSNRYRYDLELHVFMWGGPKKGGGEDGLKDWLDRMNASSACLRSARTDLVQILFEMNEPDTAISSACRRRRVIFRPGYTAYGVNNSSFEAVDRNRALRGVIGREPQVVTYPEDFWSLIKYDVDEAMSRLLVGFYPHEAGIFNSRQYQWNTSTLTPENNKLSALHLLVILRGLGPAMDPDPEGQAGSVITLNHTVEFLDFGSFVPLIQAGQKFRFFPLDSMYALTGVVLPFQSAANVGADGHGSTARIVFDPAYGIRSQLGHRRVSAGGGEPARGNLTVFITVGSGNDGDKFRWEVTQYFQNAARKISADLTPDPQDRESTNAARRRAREDVQAWIDHFVSNVCIVDLSKGREENKLQGNLRYTDWEKLRILGPERWPTEFQDL